MDLRFKFEDVKGRPRDPLRLEGFNQGGFLDHFPREVLRRNAVGFIKASSAAPIK